MVTSCASFNCTNRHQKGSGISFHKFPLHKPELLSKWLVAIKRDKFVPTYSHRLCSIHFTEACFWKSEGNKILEDDAVPTLFDFPDHLRQRSNMDQAFIGGSLALLIVVAAQRCLRNDWDDMQAIFRKAAGPVWRLAAIPRACHHDDTVDCHSNLLENFPTGCREAGEVIVPFVKPAAVDPSTEGGQEVKQSSDHLTDDKDCDDTAVKEPRRIAVTLCGCNGRVGRYVALQLKQSKYISQLRLHDISAVPTALSDISLIDTACEVSVFAGRHLLKQSLSDTDIVVMTAGLSRNLGLTKADLFKKNAEIVAEIAEASSQMCPRALFVIVTNPINSLVPIVSEVLHHHLSYDANRVFGLAHTHVVCASTLAARAKQLDPQTVIVPVIGGNDPFTVIPVFTYAKPSCFNKNDQVSLIPRLSNEVRNAGMEVVLAKNYRGSYNLCTAYATAHFVISLAKGLLGHASIHECAYVRSHAIHGCDYLITPVELGEYGIKHNCGLPKLTDYEKELLEGAIDKLKRDIAMGMSFFKNKYLSCT